VSWKGGRGLEGLNGQPVRMRFVLRGAELYALRVV